MIVEKETGMKLRFDYGEKNGSMTFSNVNPEADDDSLMELAGGLNSLQVRPFKTLHKIAEIQLAEE